VILCDRVSVRFGDVVALAPTTLELAAGDRVSVVGPNGSGKSTLVRILAGLREPSAGRVTGRPPPGRVVLVHQRPHLFNGTAASNVALAQRLAAEPASLVATLLDRLGLLALAGRDVRVLSGGERRRVAIARALARRPDVLLLDEPLAELDSAAAARVAALLSEFRGTLVVTSPSGGAAFAPREVRLGAHGQPAMPSSVPLP
jgi:tungstate transport system ATP-binding protein